MVRSFARLITSALLILALAGCQAANSGGALPATIRPAVPATASAPPGEAAASNPPAAPYRVLFDAGHAETAGNADWIISTSQPDPLDEHASPGRETDWTGALSAWGIALQQTGRYRLWTLPRGERFTYGDRANPLDLANFDVLIVPEPNTRFTDDEKTALMTFVQDGGGLFMIADHARSDRNNDGIDSPQIWNDLMSDNAINRDDPFGFSFDLADIPSENPSRIPPAANDDPVIRGPFGTVTGSIIRGGTTATINPDRNPNVRGLIYRDRAETGGTTGVFFLTSAFGSGRVAALGDSSPVDDGTGNPNDQLFDGWNDPAGTNAALALNATEWLAQGGAPTAEAAPTAMPAVAPRPTGVQLIQNGDFERGAEGWRISRSDRGALISDTRPHSGSQGAQLCGNNNCEEMLAQTITIPAGATRVALSYYTYLTTEETRHAYDFLTVAIRDENGDTLQVIERLDDGSPAGRWQQTTADLSDYAGQTIELVFEATSGRAYPTEFFVDDISLAVQ